MVKEISTGQTTSIVHITFELCTENEQNNLNENITIKVHMLLLYPIFGYLTYFKNHVIVFKTNVLNANDDFI